VTDTEDTQTSPRDRTLVVLRLLKGKDFETEAKELGVPLVDLATWLGNFVTKGHEAIAESAPVDPNAATDGANRAKHSRMRTGLVLFVTVVLAALPALWVVRPVPRDSLYLGRYMVRVPGATEVLLAYSNTYYLLAESDGNNPIQTYLTYKVQSFGASAKQLFPSVIAAPSFPTDTRTCLVDEPAADTWDRGTWAGAQYLQAHYNNEGVADSNRFGILAISTLRDRGMLIFNVFTRGRQPDTPEKWQLVHDYFHALGNSAKPPVAMKELAEIKPPSQQPLCLGPYTIRLPNSWRFSYHSLGRYQIQRGSVHADLWYRANMSTTVPLKPSTAVWKGWAEGRCLQAASRPVRIRPDAKRELGAGVAQRYEQIGPKRRHGILAAIMGRGGDALVFDVSIAGPSVDNETWTKLENLRGKLNSLLVSYAPGSVTSPDAAANTQQVAQTTATKKMGATALGDPIDPILPQGACAPEENP
jgi:hypothetical protein